MTTQPARAIGQLPYSKERRQARSPADPHRASEQQLRAWMAAGLDGDAPSHASVLRAVRPMLTNFFARRLGSRGAEIEDLVQEVLIAIHQRRASYDRTRPFTPWLFAVARYKLIDHYRRSRRDEPIERYEDVLASEGCATEVESRLDAAALLATLPPKQAMAVRLTRIVGMSVAEAAARLEIGESDLKVSAHRGMRTLSARVAALARA